jgi:hypothetical protein
MAESSVAEGLGKVVLGGAVGFALYYLITGLGFGGLGFGGLGFGGRGRGRGEGRGEAPDPSPLPPVPPPRPRDDKRLLFLMTEPRAVGHPTGFQSRLGNGQLDPKIYTVEELIERVKAGGRSDVDLRATGAVIQGPWDDARARIRQAGIKIWVAETSSPRAPAHVVGNDRGRYGLHGRTW